MLTHACPTQGNDASDALEGGGRGEEAESVPSEIGYYPTSECLSHLSMGYACRTAELC